MGVYIKGMKMPKDCYDCPCHNGENGRCQITKETTEDKRPYDCPLVEEKTGEWMTTEYSAYNDTYQCSACGIEWEFISGTPQDNGANYCPNCGARMEEKNE